MRRLIAVLTLLIIVISFTACKGKDTSSVDVEKEQISGISGEDRRGASDNMNSKSKNREKSEGEDTGISDINDKGRDDNKISSATKEVDKVSYIVSQYGYIIGGSKKGEWIDAEHIKDLIKGGEKYRVYSLTGLLGECTGGKPAYEEGPCIWWSIPLECEGSKLEKEMPGPNMGDYASFFSKKVSIYCTWDPQPRKPEIQRDYIDAYKEAVQKIIKDNNVSKAEPVIRQVLRVDLEGDGVDEAIITASNLEFPLTTFSSRPAYSLVILHKVIEGEDKYILLEKEFYPEDSNDNYCLYAYYVPFILDVNGDGVMEVFTEGVYYEGEWTNVHEIKDGKAELAVTYGVGA